MLDGAIYGGDGGDDGEDLSILDGEGWRFVLVVTAVEDEGEGDVMELREKRIMGLLFSLFSKTYIFLYI